MASVYYNRVLSYKVFLDSSYLSNLSNSIYEGIGIKKNPIKHSRCISNNNPNEICKRVGNGIWRLFEIHIIWKNITTGKAIDMKKIRMRVSARTNVLALADKDKEGVG